jgi:predicted Zn-dependent protease
MRRIIASALAVLLIAGCATSPLGRQQLVLMPEGQLDSMGAAAFQQIQQQTRRSPDAAVNEYVRCVADQVTNVANAERKWEVVVLDDDSANAFALPGGHIGVHQGLLRVAENQHQLAAVIGHEVGHVLARHANERVSQQFAAEQGLALVEALTSGVSPGTQRTMLGLLGVGAQFGILLPYSRIQEIEADELGLDLMARAGFDPREAVELWRNMEQAAGTRPPEFLSTHPAGERRIEQLEERMEHALELHREARAAGRNPQCRPPG